MDKSKEKVFVEFLNWMLEQGQSMTSALDYAPVPEAVREKERDAIKLIR
jgi:ABC-type phosphate transport system substrate-binding protein